jgi:hypothetical protein
MGWQWSVVNQSGRGVMAGRRRLVVAVVISGALLAVSLLTARCGAEPPSPESPIPVAGSTGSESTVATAEPATVTESSGERLPAPALDEIAYIDVVKSTLERFQPEKRRILSPALDQDVIQSLLDEVASTSVIAEPGSADQYSDWVLVAHLLDGDALTFRWEADPAQGALVDYTGWRPSMDYRNEDRYAPLWSKRVLAPELLQLAEETLAVSLDFGPAWTPPESMPADFGFVAAFGIYGKRVFDTFTGDFYEDMILPPGTTATAYLSLDQEQLHQAYTDFCTMGVFSYPTNFVPKAVDMWVTPSSAYYLRIRAAGVEKEIRWNDGTLSNDSQAVALRAWFETLARLIDASPERQALPAIRGGYD